jgi:molecular chaperone GrpE
MTKKKDASYLNADKAKVKTADELAYEKAEKCGENASNTQASSQAQEHIKMDQQALDDEYLSGKKTENSDYDELLSEDESTKSDAGENEEKYLRLAADFQNFKRRTQKETTEIYSRAIMGIATDLLEVLDNFERAIVQDKKNKADEKFLEGMEMILKQFLNILEKNGVKEIEAQGTDFDPNLHSAIQTQKASDTKPGKVVSVMQKGYIIGDKVLRPSMVIVSE